LLIQNRQGDNPNNPDNKKIVEIFVLSKYN